MNESPADRSLRQRLQSLHAPEPSAGLRQQILASAARDAARRGDTGRNLRWWPAVAAALVIVVAAGVGLIEYREWRETQELAELDTLTVASMLVL